MRKSFFNEDSTVTAEGGKILVNLDNYFSKIYEDYMELGYSPRELSLIIMDSMTLIQAKKNGKISEKIEKERKDKIRAEQPKKTKIEK